ncbi:MBL fold metallo-hydrolase [Pseudooceanicola sediminis]|uniref:MBL fold metallo-hydrolase n=1 Tax=Pseudooceanicola sediminis TaxID=2211117 RepID=A0A399IVQ4_9RHOB|nr:MBL fold metallo-hydrolase [Pseudooceanicola sediminis]KAA2312200.1 MBL fold metallo-hydrolase [Puniceibacterium sp. HSS470]RII37238.1 MBL fold metallo-hydrolase [Pseudooceanicola sediminis]|tara:strand:+ start:54262 stop:55644 length:1383 start_codon:yes stop_codon:yes gene_type:complete
MTRSNRPSLRFLGAAGTVTGSRYLLEIGRRRILVDCGLFQGFKQLRARNRKPFPVRPSTIDTVLLTHAHLDHSGYLPALIRAGYRGRVICTSATAELCGLILPDSGHIQEEEARYAARRGFSKHKNPKPLYTLKDAEAALDRFETVDFGQRVDLGDDITATFIPAGHLLGAAQIRIEFGGKVIHFSGDLGHDPDPLMRPPKPFAGADVLVCESTYGNRVHPGIDPEAELAPVLKRVFARGGTVLIPSFAVGRAQGLMLHISRLIERGEIPYVPVFLNSPMSVDATEIYHRHHDEHHVSREECVAMFQLAKRVNTVAQSKELNTRAGPMIIISASGMLTGGRILHHLASFGGDRRNAILLSGFQAGGTRGAALAEGARKLRMFGRDFPIEAEVVQLQSFSGHADAEEILRWMSAGPVPRMTYVTHGEPSASDTLRFRIDHELGRPARAPEHLETVYLDRPR